MSDSYYQPEDPTYCATHGEDCEVEPMDDCEGWEGDDGPDPDDERDRWLDSQWED